MKSVRKYDHSIIQKIINEMKHSNWVCSFANISLTWAKLYSVTVASGKIYECGFYVTTTIPNVDAVTVRNLQELCEIKEELQELTLKDILLSHLFKPTKLPHQRGVFKIIDIKPFPQKV